MLSMQCCMPILHALVASHTQMHFYHSSCATVGPAASLDSSATAVSMHAFDHFLAAEQQQQPP
jgi:hypothetical protein